MADKTAASKASACAAPPSPTTSIEALKTRAEVNLVEAVAVLSQERLTASSVQKTLARTMRASTALRQIAAAINVKREVLA